VALNPSAVVAASHATPPHLHPGPALGAVPVRTTQACPALAQRLFAAKQNMPVLVPPPPPPSLRHVAAPQRQPSALSWSVVPSWTAQVEMGEDAHSLAAP
jgi:hypothetical protein